MNKKTKVFIRNVILFPVVWNLVVFIFKKPYEFNFVTHVVVPVVVAVLAMLYENWHNGIVNAAMPQESKPKKFDPYHHE